MLKKENYKYSYCQSSDTLQQQQFQFETELTAIPYNAFEEALKHLPYGHVCRIGLQLLAATGCRITELDNMDPANLMENELYWSPGKNQKGLRKERLPDSFLEEWRHYRASERIVARFMLGINSQTFVRYFDRDCRPLIGGAWMDRATLYMNGRGWTEGWRLHLKGFRKTWQTLLFAYFYKRYGDAGVALEWVSRRMKHSSKRITAYHYIQDFEKIQKERWLAWLETGQAPVQSRLLNYI